MLNEFTFWFIFGRVITVLFIIDLYVTEHRSGKISLKASLIWSGVWICTALVFNVFIYFYLEDGHTKALEFLTGWLIEKSLSVDNLFVFLMIFRVMKVPAENQPHVLKWGILGAIVFRILFIVLGVGLIKLFHPIIYIFALILLYAAYKMAFDDDHDLNPKENPLFKIAQKYFKFLPEYSGKHFFVKQNEKIFATSMFLTFLVIESSDIVFAIDSIPAIIAITRDEFIIISSNIFAILGLRALYFALAGVVDIFKYLKFGVAVILFYVGIKMLLSDIYKIPTEYSLGVILFVLAGSIIFSIIGKKRDDAQAGRQSEHNGKKKARQS